MSLQRDNRVLTAHIAGDERWAMTQDAARLRDALGTPLPIGIPAAFIEPVDDPLGALWELVWAGLVTNDTFAPLRSHLGGPVRPRAVNRSHNYRGRMRASLPAHSGPPSAAGRWSLLPLAEPDATIRALATAGFSTTPQGLRLRG